MNAHEKIREIVGFLKGHGIDDARREAELIISHCLGIDRAALYRDNPRILEEYISKIDEFLKRRSEREPLQYILGYTEFYGLKIKVGTGILIPRPETELLVEEAIKTVKREALDVRGFSPHASRLTPLRILDLCTGSGCLALALAMEFPDAQVYGTDISDVAIGYAKDNAEFNGVKNVSFLQGNLFEPIRELFTFDLIVSNPPYIQRDDIKSLQPEIKDWEPVEALDGGEDGLDYYRAIIPEAKGYLKEGGHLMLELGTGLADAVKKIAEDTGFIDIFIKKDYAGIERIFIAK
ncbi:MAG: peptide chain release factor N(5)-glutamine methyltransferase [Nitrospira sp.]|nr:peptide chain release factor N(5)-glutamine methyltransferase [Nitrospira sp.]